MKSYFIKTDCQLFLWWLLFMCFVPIGVLNVYYDYL